MKDKVVIHSDIIIERVQALRQISEEYRYQQNQLKDILFDLNDSYLVDNRGLVEEEINIFDCIQTLTGKIEQLATALEDGLKRFEDEN